MYNTGRSESKPGFNNNDHIEMDGVLPTGSSVSPLMVEILMEHFENSAMTTE